MQNPDLLLGADISPSWCRFPDLRDLEKLIEHSGIASPAYLYPALSGENPCATWLFPEFALKRESDSDSSVPSLHTPDEDDVLGMAAQSCILSYTDKGPGVG